MGTTISTDRAYALQLAREDLYTRSPHSMTTPSFTVDTITKRAEEYLTWLKED